MSDRSNRSLADIDKDSILHPATSIEAHLKDGPLIVAKGHGLWVTDQNGRRIMDFGAGLWCVNIGYGRAELADAAAAAIRDICYFPLFFSNATEPTIRLAERILTDFHEKSDASHLSKVFFGTSGSDANDTNYKLVRYYNNLRGLPRKKKFITRWGAYHGSTYASASLTGIAGYHTGFDLPISDIFHAPCPHYYRYGRDGETEEQFTDRMIADIQEIIARESADTIAAFIAEPVMGTGGVIPPPVGYFARLQEHLRENDILFIADEVITGLGRVGSHSATGLYGLRPDIISLAKGLTSAYFPLSASVISEKIWNTLRKASPKAGPFMHGFTYSGHPVGAAIGLANLDIIEREGLIENARKMGALFVERLRARIGDHPHVGDIRGVGLMVAVEFVADKKSKTFFKAGKYPHRIVQQHASNEGMLIRALPMGDVTSMSPPLCITTAEVEEGVERYARALDAATPAIGDLARS
jgi:L-2,4-diaminobutyrate transaminase